MTRGPLTSIARERPPCRLCTLFPFLTPHGERRPTRPLDRSLPNRSPPRRGQTIRSRSRPRNIERDRAANLSQENRTCTSPQDRRGRSPPAVVDPRVYKERPITWQG